MIGFLAAAGLLTAGGVAIFGVAGLLLIIPAALWLRRRRANSSSCATPDTVPVQIMSRPAEATAAPDRVGSSDGEAMTTR